MKCTILVLVVWIYFGFTTTQAQTIPPYGYTVRDQAYAADAPLSQSVTATGFFSDTNVESVCGSDEVFVLCNGGAGAFSGSVINGQLIGINYAGIGSGVPGPPPYEYDPYWQKPDGTWYPLVQGSYQAYSEGDLAFYDTFYISGPANQTGDFQVTVTFQSNNLTEQTVAEADAAQDVFLLRAGLFKNGVYIDWGTTSGNSLSEFDTPLGPWYTLPTTQTASTAVSAQSGSAVVLGIIMIMRAELIQPNLYSGALVHQWGSLYMTVTPLTSGFGFTTASGLSYATAPLPPFPPTVNMSMGGTNVSLPFYTQTNLGGTNISISFSTQTNHIYWVTYKNTLSDSSWSILPGSSRLGDGTTKTIVDQMQVSQRFYRIAGL